MRFLKIRYDDGFGEKTEYGDFGVCFFPACCTLLNIHTGKQVHGLSMKLEACDHVMVVTALVDMYLKCGCWGSAFDVLMKVKRGT